MNYEFPIINHISDVEKYVDTRFFYYAVKDGYTVINYRINIDETFPEITDDIKTKIVREFRGIIFDSETGNIIRRPLHKFHNVGEKWETSIGTLDISKPHMILEKLDGSMIAPFRVKDQIIWGTKLGETPASTDPQLYAEASSAYTSFANVMLTEKLTPIFEWCSNKNRIVLDYPEDRLVLLAIRDMKTGEYLSYERMVSLVGDLPIPIVQSYEGTFDQDMVDKIRPQVGVEGIVVRFDGGGMLKVKADHYCQLHRVKSDINKERNVTALILDEKADDLKPLMSSEDLEKFKKFEAELYTKVLQFATLVVQYAVDITLTKTSRKDFALGTNAPQYIKHMIFHLWDNLEKLNSDEAHKEVVAFIRKNCNNTKNYESMKKKGMILETLSNWGSVMFTDEENNEG